VGLHGVVHDESAPRFGGKRIDGISQPQELVGLEIHFLDRAQVGDLRER